jgi:hypothetical protein
MNSAYYSAIQTLQAQQRQTLASIANLAATVQSQATTSSSSTSGTPKASLQFLSAPVTIFTQAGSGAVAQTFFDAAAFIPSSATVVLLSFYGRRDSGVTGVQYVTIQAAPTGSSFPLWGSNSQGTDTDTEGYLGQALMPCSGAGFYYTISDGIEDITMSLVGYVG